VTKQEKYDMDMWTVTVHRWSERDQRYRATVEESAAPVMVCCDPDNHKQCRQQHSKDKAAGYMVLEMRNQQLTAVEFDPFAHTLTFWAGQRTVRAWRKTSKTRLPKPHGVRCLCQHSLVQHDDSGQCRIDGCGCQVYFQKLRGETLADCEARFMVAYGNTDVRKPRLPIRSEK
jgi:hypothetical protein